MSEKKAGKTKKSTTSKTKTSTSKKQKATYMPFEKEVETLTKRQLENRLKDNNKVIQGCKESYERGMGKGWLHVQRRRERHNELIYERLKGM